MSADVREPGVGTGESGVGGSRDAPGSRSPTPDPPPSYARGWAFR